MIKIIFMILVNFYSLYAFLGFQNDEQFEIVSDFGKLNEYNKLNLGLKIKAFSNEVSIFSDNYKVLYSKNKNNSNENSILIIFDLDLNLELDIFGDFIYENEKIKFLFSNTILDLVVRDDKLSRLINPVFVLKNNNNLSFSSSDFDLENISLISENDEYFIINEAETANLAFYNYSVDLKIKSVNNKSNLKGIYYLEIFLNNKSVFRKEFQNMYLDRNEYKLSHDIDNLNSDDLENLKLHNLKFNKGKNQIKVEYGDVYSNKKIRNFRINFNE